MGHTRRKGKSASIFGRKRTKSLRPGHKKSMFSRIRGPKIYTAKPNPSTKAGRSIIRKQREYAKEMQGYFGINTNITRRIQRDVNRMINNNEDIITSRRHRQGTKALPIPSRVSRRSQGIEPEFTGLDITKRQRKVPIQSAANVRDTFVDPIPVTQPKWAFTGNTFGMGALGNALSELNKPPAEAHHRFGVPRERAARQRSRSRERHVPEVTTNSNNGMKNWQ